MDNRQKEINNLKDYKYGFSTDIENIQAPKGLNEDVIKFISNIKKEPQWMLEFRLKAFERFKVLKENGLVFQSQVAYLIPIFGVVLGYIFLGEIITDKVIIALVAIILGIYLVKKSTKRIPVKV